MSFAACFIIDAYTLTPSPRRCAAALQKCLFSCCRRFAAAFSPLMVYYLSIHVSVWLISRHRYGAMLPLDSAFDAISRYERRLYARHLTRRGIYERGRGACEVRCACVPLRRHSVCRRCCRYFQLLSCHTTLLIDYCHELSPRYCLRC